MAYTGKFYGNNIHPVLETTTLAEIDGRYKIIYANLSSATRLSFTTGTVPESGQEYAIIIRNNSSNTLDLDSILPTGGNIIYNGGKELKSGQYAEVEILYITATNFPTFKAIVSLSFSWPGTNIAIISNPTNIAWNATSHTITYKKQTGYWTTSGFISVSEQTGLTNTITITQNSSTASRTLSHTIEGQVFQFVQEGKSGLLIGTNYINNTDTSKPQITTLPRNPYFRLWKFIPDISGTYRFAFSDAQGSNIDTYAYLLNSSQSILINNDDSNGGADPLFEYSLTAGTTYYYAIGPFSSGDVSGILTITKV